MTILGELISILLANVYEEKTPAMILPYFLFKISQECSSLTVEANKESEVQMRKLRAVRDSTRSIMNRYSSLTIHVSTYFCLSSFSSLNTVSVLHLLDGNLLDCSFTRSLTPFELDGKRITSENLITQKVPQFTGAGMGHSGKK